MLSPPVLTGLGATLISLKDSFVGTGLFALGTLISARNELNLCIKKSSKYASRASKEDFSVENERPVGIPLIVAIKDFAASPAAVVYLAALSGLITSISTALSRDLLRAGAYLAGSAGNFFLATILNKQEGYEIQSTQRSKILSTIKSFFNKFPIKIKSIISNPGLHFALCNSLFALSSVGSMSQFLSTKTLALTAGIAFSFSAIARGIWPIVSKKEDLSAMPNSLILASAGLLSFSISSLANGDVLTSSSMLLWSTSNTIAAFREGNSWLNKNIISKIMNV